MTRAYRASHPHAPRVVIGDISREGGGPMDDHVSHQNGLDVDVYFPRLDRVRRAPTTAGEIDHRLAQDLLNRFVAAGAQILEMTPSGSVSPLGGDGSYLFRGDGGLATSARLNAPVAVAVGTDGALYIADQGNHRVRKVDAEGTISTLLGDGTAGNASGQLNSPAGVAKLATLLVASLSSRATKFVKLPEPGLSSTATSTRARSVVGAPPSVARNDVNVSVADLVARVRSMIGESKNPAFRAAVS